MKSIVVILSSDTSNVCNTNCIFCGLGHYKNTVNSSCQQTHFLNVNTDFLDQIKTNLVDTKQYDIVLTTGPFEPTMYSNMTDLVDKIKSRSIGVEIVTNGILLDTIDDRVLRKIDRINVSLLSHDRDIYQQLRDNGQYERVNENFVKLPRRVDSTTRLVCSTIICSETVDSLPVFCTFASDHGYIPTIDVIRPPWDNGFYNFPMLSFKYLFQLNLSKLEKTLNILINRFPSLMPSDYANNILYYFQNILEKPGRDVSEPICSTRIIFYNPNGPIEERYMCPSKLVHSKSIDDLETLVNKCTMWCGVIRCQNKYVEI